MNISLLKKILLVSVFCNASVYATNLLEAYQAALSYNADYLKVLSDSEATVQQKNMAFSQLWPQLGVTGQYNQNYLHQDNLDLVYHQPQVALSLSQSIFDWNKLSQYSKAKYGVKVTDAQNENAKQQLFLSVSQAYYNVLYAKDTESALKDGQTALAQQLIQAKMSFDAGTATMADIADAQAGFDSGAAQVLQAENDIIYKSNLYQNLTGLSADDIKPLVTNMDLTLIESSSLESVNRYARDNNNELKVARLQVEMAKQDLSSARGNFAPTVNVNGSYGYQWTGGLDSISGAGAAATQATLNLPGGMLSNGSNAQVGLQVSMPIFTSGSLTAQVRQMSAQLDASNQSMISTSRTIDQSIKNDYWSVRNYVAIIRAQQQSLKSAKLKLDSDTLGVRAGVRTMIDLVNSQKNYAQTLQSYALSRYSFLVAQAQLQYDLGFINEEFIKKINANVQ